MATVIAGAWWLASRTGDERQQRGDASGAPVEDAARAPSRDGRAIAAGNGAVPAPTTAPADALGALDPKEAWRAQIGRAVAAVARERGGRPLTPDEQTRLVDALASVGPAARSLDREPLDPDDPASIARVRQQTQVLVDADRQCRDLLGIGVAELLHRLDPDAVEDRGGDDTAPAGSPADQRQRAE